MFWLVASGSRRQLDLEPGREQRLTVDLASAGPWTGHAGPRCGKPQPVRFEFDGADAGARIALRWEVVFEVSEKTSLSLCSSEDILASKASVTIDAVSSS